MVWCSMAQKYLDYHSLGCGRVLHGLNTPYRHQVYDQIDPVIVGHASKKDRKDWSLLTLPVLICSTATLHWLVQGTNAFVDLGPQQLSTSDQLEQALKGCTASTCSGPRAVENDLVYPSSLHEDGDMRPKAVLYGLPGDSSFTKLHQALKSYAEKGDVPHSG